MRRWAGCRPLLPTAALVGSVHLRRRVAGPRGGGAKHCTSGGGVGGECAAWSALSERRSATWGS
eukprot:2750785-Prymnesium_polylepis.1